MPLPSVLLHDHLDGGLRPTTVLELAAAQGYEGLPTSGPESLAAWFDQSESGSLESYLEAFTHTIAVMQDYGSLERIAYEAGVDLAADGVVYAEIRFCPELHAAEDLRPPQVIEAVASGLAAAGVETGLEWGMIIDSLRHIHDSLALARLASRYRDAGVVAFDLAGPEAGYPPDDHLAACRHAREAGLRLTIHAGEAGRENGVAYMASAMDRCGAERLGHGVEIINDCLIERGEVVKLGPVADRIRSRRIPLEVCPSSNLATGGLEPGSHPVGMLHRAGFNVTLSTDNRLMSNTSMSAEFEFVRDHHGFTIDDLATVTWRSLDAAFCDWATKRRLWEDHIAPAYAEAGADVRLEWR
jgi:adenosine deaminase